MHYTTRFAPESIREGIVAARRSGMTVAQIQRSFNVSKHTVYRWLNRSDTQTRSSRPHRQPRWLGAEIEQRIVAARQELRWGPNRLANHLGMPASTVHKVLRRHGINRLAPKEHLPAVAYQKDVPGELVHVDVKKLGRLGLEADQRLRRRFPGHECLHLMIDDCTRIGYAEIHPIETAATSTAFFERAVDWYASIGIGVQRVMSDRGAAYTSLRWRDTCQLLGLRPIYTRPRRPQTNGKCERWIRTIVDEALRGRAYGSLQARARVIGNYVNNYNTRRQHTALGGLTPFQKLLKTDPRSVGTTLKINRYLVLTTSRATRRLRPAMPARRSRSARSSVPATPATRLPPALPRSPSA